VSTFYTGSTSRAGLSAAIGVLTNGIVLVGNLLTADGTSATAQPGTMSVLDRFGNFLGTFGSVNGPWGMAVDDIGNAGTGSAHVFISNVLTGTITRYDVTYTNSGINVGAITLASGFNHRADPAALELGPAGLVYNPANDTLYVASSSDNAVYSIPTATGNHPTPVSPALLFQDFTHLHGPLDLTILPNGHFLVANSDGSNVDPNQPSELVEYTASGQFIAQSPVDPNNGGAFGLGMNNMGWGTVRLAYVDDNTNTLNINTTVVH
jgi:DNA-binding beta-propeller fold protein YncE